MTVFTYKLAMSAVNLGVVALLVFIGFATNDKPIQYCCGGVSAFFLIMFVRDLVTKA